MTSSLWPHLIAAACVIPAAVVAWRGAREAPFWAVFGFAALAATGWAAAQQGSAWSAGFGAALWLTVAATLVIYLVLCLVLSEMRQVGCLLAPYMAFLALAAAVWSQAPGRPLSEETALGWFGIHVTLSLGTYVFLTLAAVAGAAVVLQERALKRREPGRLTNLLPSLSDSEQLEYRMLGAGEVILAAAIVTGMGAQYAADGSLIDLNHKTILTIAAFLVIGALLFARQRWGTRGRLAARYVLIGYLLVTLAYPGVKFVTDVLIS
ncbi:MAG: cytochrome c biogenesis protein CcsA [Rhodospirillales bacterium]|nr:cytochrome c biogenesis protein CcsA [Rhodospirillales bacterium]